MVYSLSSKDVVRLGRALREPEGLRAGEALSNYSEYLAQCEFIRNEVESRIRNLFPLIVDITGRVKTLQTLTEKLQRFPEIQLPAINDVVGVRMVSDITLREQTKYSEIVIREFGSRCQVIDRRMHPTFGYRALHVVIRNRAVRTEVQLRTRLQEEWADFFERLADRWGRGIRYGEVPSPDVHGLNTSRSAHIEAMIQFSLTEIAQFEHSIDTGVPTGIQSLFPGRTQRESMSNALRNIANSAENTP